MVSNSKFLAKIYLPNPCKIPHQLYILQSLSIKANGFECLMQESHTYRDFSYIYTLLTQGPPTNIEVSLLLMISCFRRLTYAISILFYVTIWFERNMEEGLLDTLVTKKTLSWLRIDFIGLPIVIRDVARAMLNIWVCQIAEGRK